MENTWFNTSPQKRSIQCSKRKQLGTLCEFVRWLWYLASGSHRLGGLYNSHSSHENGTRFHVAAMVGMQMDEGLKFMVKYPTSRQAVVLQMMNRTWQKLGVLELNMMLSYVTHLKNMCGFFLAPNLVGHFKTTSVTSSKVFQVHPLERSFHQSIQLSSGFRRSARKPSLDDIVSMLENASRFQFALGY